MPELKPDRLRRYAPTAWLFQMAWRDSRKNRARLFLFMSSIILGIAALVAVYSFRDNLQRAIDQQAKTLTGSDLTLDSRKEISTSARALLNKLGDQRAKQLDFVSMLFFVQNQESRLVQIRALEGDYPFYGKIATTPAGAAGAWKNGRNVLVDRTVMLQYKAKPGDSVSIGKLKFAIAGYLDQSPGQTGLSATLSPAVYIPLRYLPQTGLVQFGSRIHYAYFYRFNNPGNVPLVLKHFGKLLDREGLDHETVETRKERTGRTFHDLTSFLALSGFVALLLGCVGVGSAVHVYIQEKIAAISTLRCLGLRARDAFLIYLIQLFFVGLAGAVLGAAAGTGLQFLLPLAFKEFLPVEFGLQISWAAVWQGIVTGVLVAVLFALPSLLSVRHISPLNAIRLAVEPAVRVKEPFKVLVYGAIVLFIFGFTFLQTGNWLQTLGLAGGLMAAIGVFYMLSGLMISSLRNLLPAGLNYSWRQGFSNLYRPNNQTVMLIVAIGLSTTLISTLYFVQDILISRVTLSAGKDQPNIALFDIQTNQLTAVNKATEKFGLPLLMQVPVVTMRLVSINGQAEQQGWDFRANAFKSELRATYQRNLTAAETVTSGTWTGKADSGGREAGISLDERYAEQLRVRVGDHLVFNVQGLEIPTVISSLRSINWGRLQTNFRIVFPEGVLENAPQFHVLMTRVPDARISALYQAAIVRTFPNVSLADLNLVLSVLDQLFQKISFVIRFMASFSIITGWLVLVSAVRNSKNQRLRETVLLRTLGAKRRQVLAITGIEYFFLGILAAAAGLLVSLAASWALAVFTFGGRFTPGFLSPLILLISVTLIVVITGVLSSRSILDQSPLEVLRKDS